MTNEIIDIRLSGKPGKYFSTRQTNLVHELKKLGFTPMFNGADIQTWVRTQKEANQINKLLEKYNAYVVNSHKPQHSFEDWLRAWT